ncbi:IucA/IucC family C-terminal-domain containing protein [Fredinandcohnia sp. 179-A 10B2 NHS]|uniref:IucA/IucC family C-terminal-domain containing protein n=1 Tax=Fredinandcohnia sp. 179-A 10B2 NHS TaxID=3235176 RepID=UPI0039A2BE14
MKEFRYIDRQFESDLSIPVSDLLDEVNLSRYVTNIQKKIAAPDKRVAASMFMKRYGFFAVLNLYAMTILNKRLDSSLANVSLETNENEQEIWYWNPKFYLQTLDTIPAPQTSRKKWRDETIRAIFHEHIHEVLIKFAEQSKLSKKVLWENIAIYIFWLYESLLSNPKFEEKKARIQDDYEYIVSKADGELFGPLNFNPLTRFYGQKVYRPEYDQEIRMRKTCCLYYKTSNSGDRCKTCPLGCVK